MKLALHLHGDGVRHVLVVVRGGEVDDFTGVAQANGREQFHFAGFQREDDFIGGAENAAFALGFRACSWSDSRCRGPCPRRHARGKP